MSRCVVLQYPVSRPPLLLVRRCSSVSVHPARHVDVIRHGRLEELLLVDGRMHEVGHDVEAVIADRAVVHLAPSRLEQQQTIELGKQLSGGLMN